MSAKNWFAPEGDVHLRIWLSDLVFNYAVTGAAVRNLSTIGARKPWCTIELIGETVEDGRLLPYLPGERLFVGP